MPTNEPPALFDHLRTFGQEHLLRFWHELTTGERQSLADQIEAINFQQIADLYQQATSDSKSNDTDCARRAEPPPAIRLRDRTESLVAEARRRGEQLLAAGKVGVVLVAGGQGTRLGFDHPKGLFPIGPVSRACLFQILLEQLLAVRRRSGANIPLYVMTSPATHDETVAAFEQHQRFGLPREDVMLFCQGTMPTVDAKNGQLLLETKGSLFLSPDGHGGMLRSLSRSGALADLRRRGIKQLFYMQVDNPLVSVCDAEFLGHHLTADAEVSTQVVAKQAPRERVGNVVAIDGRVQIIEYSDLADDVADQRLPDGSLKLWAGNMAVHAFGVDFLRRMAEQGQGLPFHFARKKVPFIDDVGKLIEPTDANAIKFEQFIFDLLPAARRSLVVEMNQNDSFAPVKNDSSAATDTPETVQAQMMDLHRQWLRAAGAAVADEVRVEISPLFALDAVELATKMPPGTKVDRDRYFR